MRRSDRIKIKGKRDYQAYMVAGGKGQGKSTFLRDMIDDYLKKFRKVYEKEGVHPRVFVHDFSESRAFQDIPTVQEAAQKLGVKLEHPMDILQLKDKHGEYVWKKGALRYVCVTNKEIQYMYNILSNHFTNGLCIYDEWTAYVKYNPPEWQLDPLIKHRNRGVELVFVIHQLMKVPSIFVRGDMISKFILFKTGENNITFNQLKNKYSFAEKLWKAFQRVKKAKITDKYVQYYEIITV